MPALLVARESLLPVLRLVMVTMAPGSGVLVSSTISPVSVPAAEFCARASEAPSGDDRMRSVMAIARRLLVNLSMSNPPGTGDDGVGCRLVKEQDKARCRVLRANRVS